MTPPPLRSLQHLLVHTGEKGQYEFLDLVSRSCFSAFPILHCPAITPIKPDPRRFCAVAARSCYLCRQPLAWCWLACRSVASLGCGSPTEAPDHDTWFIIGNARLSWQGSLLDLLCFHFRHAYFLISISRNLAPRIRYPRSRSLATVPSLARSLALATLTSEMNDRVNHGCTSRHFTRAPLS